MYCARCELHHFAGSRCPACGDLMVRGGMKFNRMGEPLAKSAEAQPATSPFAPPSAGRARKEAGRSEGLIVRLAYKLLESVFTCALFSVTLRMAIFLVKVADSLMQTGGDVREGISLYQEIQRGIGWYEVGIWGVITVFIFLYRHNPR